MITDTSEQVLGQDLPALVEDGYSSFKIYMTYEGMALDDRQILEVLATARRTGAMVMIHAENDHCIHWLTKQLERIRRHIAGAVPKMAPMPVEREATHRAITLAEIVDVPFCWCMSRHAKRWSRSSGAATVASRSMARPVRNTCS